MKRFMIVCAATVAIITLCACSRTDEYVAPLPTPSIVLPARPTGNEMLDEFTAQLYFVSESGTMATEERVLKRAPGQSRAEAVISAMLDGPTSPSLKPSMPEGMGLLSVELSSNVANVLLTGIMPSEKEWLTARVAAAGAVCAAEKSITSVNLYIEGQEPGYMKHPLGAQTPIDMQLDEYLESLYQGYVLSNQQVANGQEFHDATMYFADETGELLVAENHSIKYINSQAHEATVQSLVEELISAQPVLPGMKNAIPRDLTMAQAPIIEHLVPDDDSILRETTDDGRGEAIVHLFFNRPKGEFDLELFSGALTLTITGYIPEVRAVGINFLLENGAFSAINSERHFERERFAYLVGHTLELAYPKPEGSILYNVTRTVPQTAIYDPKERLKALFSGTPEPGLAYTMFDEDDISDVYTIGDMVVINWSRGFTNKLKRLISEGWSTIPADRRESLFIFGIIDTVTQIPGLNRVWMLENGKTTDGAGRIYLGKPIMRNPGIIIDGNG